MKSKDGVEIKTEFVDKEGQIMLLKLSGYIDQSNAYLLEKAIMNGLDSECYKMIFDFEELIYMSSAGWGVLVGEIKRFRQFGGDLKLVNMSSNLYEVYQMLEFYHIVDEYSSLNEAVESFVSNNKSKRHKDSNNSLSLDEKKDIQSVSEAIEKDEAPELGENKVAEKELGSSDETPDKDLSRGDAAKGERIDFNPMIIERPVDFKKLPLTEKLRSIVARYPHFSLRQIRKVLSHEEFGRVKIGYFKLRKILKELELDTKEKRYRYYRSC